MELRQLNYFVRIVETGSFSRAAIDLQVAQPALSRQIRRLEEELGTMLLYRNGRGVSLTRAGEILFSSSTEVLQKIETTTREISESKSELSGSAVIGLPPTVGRILAIPLAAMFREHFPAVRLQIVEGFSGNVLEWLSTGRIDVGVLYSDPGANLMVAEPLVVEELLIIGPPADRSRMDAPASGAEVPLSAMTDLPLILPSRPHGLRRLIDETAASHGHALNVVMDVDSFHTMLELVRSGLGYTILPPASVVREPVGESFTTWKIVDPQFTRTLYVATAAQRSTAVAKRELARLVRRQIMEIATQGLWRAI
jgi:LysR family nitrogen assimilation transcriptional regulator